MSDTLLCASARTLSDLEAPAPSRLSCAFNRSTCACTHMHAYENMKFFIPVCVHAPRLRGLQFVRHSCPPQSCNSLSSFSSKMCAKATEQTRHCACAHVCVNICRYSVLEVVSSTLQSTYDHKLQCCCMYVWLYGLKLTRACICTFRFRFHTAFTCTWLCGQPFALCPRLQPCIETSIY